MSATAPTSILSDSPTTRDMDQPALATAVVGGLAVVTSYVLVFRHETEGYFHSRFWLNVPSSTARALCYGLQIPAAIGYIVFLAYATGAVGKRGPATKGILGYWDGTGLALSVALFSAASAAWPLLTKLHLDEGWAPVWPAASLVAAAGAAVVMTAGAFEADLEWPAVMGVLVFGCVVVMADAVGWNAKLLHTPHSPSHHNL